MQLFRGMRGVRREGLPREVLAGVTLAALAIPLNIGYAQVAGLPPVVGLYAAILPLLVFALLCSSRQLVASPMPDRRLIGGCSWRSPLPDDPRYVQLAYAWRSSARDLLPSGPSGWASWPTSCPARS